MELETRLKPHGDHASVTKAARWAEDLGFKTFFASEASYEPFLPLVTAAMATERIELGTGIAVAFGRSPYVMAKSAWYIHSISGGRMVLGLGTQVKAHIERRYGMNWQGAGKPLAEYVDCMRELWRSWRDGDSPNYVGEFFRSNLSNPEFVPEPLPAGAGPIPVWIAAVGPELLRHAGRVADGVNFHAFTTPTVIRDQLMPAIEESRQKAGVTSSMRFSCSVFSGVAHDDAELRALRDHFRDIISFYGSTPTYRNVLESLGFEDLGPRLRELSRQREWKKMAGLVPDDLVDQMAVLGSARDVAHGIRQRYGSLLTQVSVYRGGDRFMTDDDWNTLVEVMRAP